jgi:hypothetical protein
VSTAPSLLFGGDLRLERAAAALYAPRGTPLSLLVELDWLAERAPGLDYKVSLRLLAPDGRSVAQADEFPIGTLLPPTTWGSGERKPGYLALALPNQADLRPGAYPLVVSLYGPASLATVPAVMPGGAAAPDPTVLAVLVVDDTMQLQSAPSFPFALRYPFCALRNAERRRRRVPQGVKGTRRPSSSLCTQA